MLHDIDLVSLAAEYSMAGHERAETQNFARLDQSGATNFIAAARMMTMRATILATGTISVFEALLQQSRGWEQPFVTLDKHLRTYGLDNLAERFLDYRDAINVLKHGTGRSHDRLLASQDQIDFAVRALEQPFHKEGDISEISTPVRADAVFIKNCARLIADVVCALRRTIPDAQI